jgi:hypothetical protein
MLPWSEVMPEPADFCSWDDVQKILELPSEVDVREETFGQVMSILPELCHGWRRRIKLELAHHFKSQYPGGVIMLTEQDAIAQLGLATTVFRCQTCDSLSHPSAGPLSGHNPLFYPKVLGHECLTKPRRPDSFLLTFDDNFREPSMKIRSTHVIRRRWTSLPLVVDPRFIEVVGRLILACGLDVATTTASAMDFHDFRLCCRDCVRRSRTDSGKLIIKAFGWRSAVSHFPTSIQRHKAH